MSIKIEGEIVTMSLREFMTLQKQAADDIEGFIEDSVKELTGEKVFNPELEITNALKNMGMPAHIMGYRYIRHAIKLCVRDQSYLSGITKRLYPAVAKEFGTSPHRAERAIRHAIETAWSRGNQQYLDEIFGRTLKRAGEKPPNSEFIAMIADIIRLSMGDPVSK